MTPRYEIARNRPYGKIRRITIIDRQTDQVVFKRIFTAWSDQSKNDDDENAAYDAAEAEARRILAALNACDGISTDALERNGIDRLIDLAAEALWRRDYPLGGSIYKNYAQTNPQDKALYRHDVLKLLEQC